MMFLVSCNNAVLGVFLKIVRNGLNLIQILGPILLIISLGYLFVKLAQHPDDKKLPKRIVNSLLALAVIFFIPTLVIAVLDMTGEGSEFGACWSSSSSGSFGGGNYIDPNKDNNNRVNIIGDSNYEKGTPGATNNGSTSSSSSGGTSSTGSTSSGSTSSENVKPVVTNDTVIFIGDSRTVQMYSYVANTWSNNSYSNGGIRQVGNDLFVSQGSMGLNWMKNTGIPAAKKYFTRGVSVAILMGVNDLRNQDQYISYLNSNVDEWEKNGASIYFVTVNPCDGDYAHMNSRINTFNSTLKNKLSKKIGWINTHDNLTFKTVDGLHYNKDTSIKIYNYIKNKV